MISGRVIVRFNDFPALADRVETSVSDAIDTANQITVMVADPLTRRDTGRLISDKTIENDGEQGAVIWNAEYAAYQNFGTYKMSGTHFADIGADAGYQALVNALRGMF